MNQLEVFVREDERKKVLEEVETLLFDHFVGPDNVLDEESDEATRRKVTLGLQRFIKLSNWFGCVFKDDWPNR